MLSDTRVYEPYGVADAAETWMFSEPSPHMRHWKGAMPNCFVTSLCTASSTPEREFIDYKTSMITD